MIARCFQLLNSYPIDVIFISSMFVDLISIIQQERFVVDAFEELSTP